MSAVYPGIDRPLPMPPPWRPEELVSPVPRSWGAARVLGRSWFPIAFWVAFFTFAIWHWKMVGMLMLVSIFAPVGCCYW